MNHLLNTIRPYAWGSTTAIPELLGTPPTGEPQAELWMGAHPGAPSRIDRGGGPVPLDAVIAADPVAELGPSTVERFGPRLPFLLKVLAAGAPLSLQVHPDLERARAGYADEEARGIPLDAPHRTYKDANHKPEMIVALSPFDGLCGFRRPAETADLIDALGVASLAPYADILRAHPEDRALGEVLAAVLGAEPAAMAATVHAATEAAVRLATDPASPHAADCAAYAEAGRSFPGDRGVIAAMLLNHVRLQPGEALYLGAGVPHAYLDGLGVEIMANSDNVLRCGLTPKHIDVPELLRVVRLDAGDVGIMRPEAASDGEELYAAPIDEFRLSRYVLAMDSGLRILDAGAPQILLCTAGRATLSPLGSHDPAAELPLCQGQSAYIPASEAAALGGAGTVFRATVAA